MSDAQHLKIHVVPLCVYGTKHRYQTVRIPDGSTHAGKDNQPGSLHVIRAICQRSVSAVAKPQPKVLGIHPLNSGIRPLLVPRIDRIPEGLTLYLVGACDREKGHFLRKMSHRQAKHKRKKSTRQQTTTARQQESTPQTPQIQLQLERPETNERQWLTFVPDFPPNHPLALILRSPEGSNGIYRVTFVLGIPGKELFLDSINIEAERHTGTSLLQMPPGAAFIHIGLVDTEKQILGEMDCLANTNGRVACVQLRLHAANFIEAQRKAFNQVMPMLSRWSYEYNVALDIKYSETVEEQTLTERFEFNLIGKEKPLGYGHIGLSRPEYRPIFAAYREAMNATNVFYQILCFYKVIEGIKNVRKKRKNALLAAGAEYKAPSDEMIPVSLADLQSVSHYLLESFQPYLGQKFTKVLDQFRGVFRNAVAHLEIAGDSLMADEFDDVTKCERAIPVIRYISRAMLHHELQTHSEMILLPVN